MPLITTPKGLRYYRFSDRTKSIWQFRLEHGNWSRLPKPVRIAKGWRSIYFWSQPFQRSLKRTGSKQHISGLYRAIGHLLVDVYLKRPDELDVIIDTALVAAAWDREPRVFVVTRQRNDPTRHVQQCVYDEKEKTMKLQNLTEYDGWVGVGMNGRDLVVAYEDQDEYGINIRTLVWEEEDEWCEGSEIDRWEGPNHTLNL